MQKTVFLQTFVVTFIVCALASAGADVLLDDANFADSLLSAPNLVAPVVGSLVIAFMSSRGKDKPASSD